VGLISIETIIALCAAASAISLVNRFHQQAPRSSEIVQRAPVARSPSQEQNCLARSHPRRGARQERAKESRAIDDCRHRSYRSLCGDSCEGAYFAWALSAGGKRLTLRQISDKNIPEATTDTAKLIESNLENPQLFDKILEYSRN